MSCSPRLPVPSSKNTFFGRSLTLFTYLKSSRGKFMRSHSTGALVAYGGTALVMAVYVLNFRPILGRIPYIKNSYPLPPPPPPPKKES